jgi:transposase
VLDKVRQLYTLKAVGINTAGAYGTEFFGWRDFRNGKQVGSMAGLTPTPFRSGQGNREQGIGKEDPCSRAGFWCGRLAIAARCPRGPAR